MGIIKTIILLLLLSIIINYGLHATIINNAETVAKKAKDYVIENCEINQAKEFLPELNLSMEWRKFNESS